MPSYLASTRTSTTKHLCHLQLDTARDRQRQNPSQKPRCRFLRWSFPRFELCTKLRQVSLPPRIFYAGRGHDAPLMNDASYDSSCERSSGRYHCPRGSSTQLQVMMHRCGCITRLGVFLISRVRLAPGPPHGYRAKTNQLILLRQMQEDTVTATGSTSVVLRMRPATTARGPSCLCLLVSP